MSSAIQIFKKTVRASSGTQSNELAAKIKSVTSSTTIGAVFLYDTRNDSDSGAWRKKARGSWYYEDLNTATRGGRREFPSVALIVADNASGTKTVTIYDLDDPAMPMWMVFNGGGVVSTDGTNELFVNTQTLTSIFALNGRLSVGATGYGYHSVNFTDEAIEFRENGYYRTYTGGVVNRNGGLTMSADLGSSGWLAHDAVNDIAMTVLEGAEIGALGLPIPTVAVATDGGVSVIHPNGSVYDQTHQVASNNKSGHVFWDDEGGLLFSTRASTNYVYFAYENQTLYADKSSAPFKVFSPATSSQGLVNYLGGNPVIAASRLSGSGFAVGGSLGLSLFKTNKGNPDESAFAYITSDYNTGYILGDIRLATLANSTVDDSTGATMHDRSVKGNNLTEQGFVHQAAVATNAELKYYTNFGSSNYLSRTYSADFNFTNTMSVMFWVKDYENSKDIYGLGTRNSTLSQSIYIDGAYDYRFTLTSDGSTEQQFEIPESGVLDQWTFICFSVNAGAVRGYKNGQNIAASNGTFTGNIFSQATDQEGLEIGKGAIASAGSGSGKLALFRLSATAPTPQQVKQIYEAEKPLFRAGAKCLLAVNQVNDLAYDSSTNLLHVASESTSSSKSFRGLEAVESLTSDGSFGLAASKPLDYVAASGGVVAGVGGDTSDADTSGCGVNLPPFDVRGDTNIADIKLPDDGKLHFSGVTTDATPTVIGSIPVAEGENYLLNVRIRCNKYQKEATNRATYIIKQSVRRNIGYNVVAEADPYKLLDESVAGMDAVVESNTTSQTANLKVTGSSATRIVWNATVEVQRISEKQYER